MKQETIEQLHARWKLIHERQQRQFEASEEARRKYLAEEPARRQAESDRRHQAHLRDMEAKKRQDEIEHRLRKEIVRTRYGGSWDSYVRDQFSYSF